MSRVVQPCGTDAAYKRHLYRRELPCAPCLLAHCDIARRRRRAVGIDPVPDVTPCGTNAAYSRHMYHGEIPDASCRRARADYVRTRR